MAQVSVARHGCQILSERSFILQARWREKHSGVCKRGSLCHTEIIHSFWISAAGLWSLFSCWCDLLAQYHFCRHSLPSLQEHNSSKCIFLLSLDHIHFPALHSICVDRSSLLKCVYVNNLANAIVSHVIWWAPAGIKKLWFEIIFCFMLVKCSRSLLAHLAGVVFLLKADSRRHGNRKLKTLIARARESAPKPPDTGKNTHTFPHVTLQTS